jgi:hypothetical protein
MGNTELQEGRENMKEEDDTTEKERKEEVEEKQTEGEE